MKSVVIFLLCASVTLRALAAPAEEALVQEVKEEPKPKEAEKQLAPGARSQLCMGGWEFHGDSCYYLNNNELTWKEAAKYCASFEATLASVHSYSENNDLQHMASKHTSGWTGGFYFEGNWRWQDGTSYDYSQLKAVPTSGYNCVGFFTRGNQGWFNKECDTALPSICKMKVDC